MDPDSMTGCAYDHSGAICRKCGYHNEQVIRAEFQAESDKSWNAYLRDFNALPHANTAWDEGFKAGYELANEKLRAFFSLVKVESPL